MMIGLIVLVVVCVVAAFMHWLFFVYESPGERRVRQFNADVMEIEERVAERNRQRMSG